MQSLLLALAHFLSAAFRRRLALQIEVVVLQHQLSVFERSRPRRFRIEPGDRVLWSWLARLWPGRGARDSISCDHGPCSSGRSAASGTTGAARARAVGRAGSYGEKFRRRVRSLDIEEVHTAPRSPWQNPYAERGIGTLRRKCLANVAVLHERHLRRVLRSHIDFYHRWRVHQSLEMDSPDHRPVQPSKLGEVVEFPSVGGPQRHYERRAA